jgi:hypothetical protein
MSANDPVREMIEERKIQKENALDKLNEYQLTQ